jgi:xanthine dehydrogenase YagS FAD-binding subunit
MMALGVSVEIQGPKGKEEIPLESLYAQPTENRRQMTTLGPADLITEIRIPPPKGMPREIYLKAMDRNALSFALVSVALSLSFGGSRIKSSSGFGWSRLDAVARRSGRLTAEPFPENWRKTPQPL